MSFSVFIDNLPQNPWIIIISVFLALISIILAVIFYFKCRREKSLIFYIKNYSLIKDFVQKIEGLKIEYSGKNINALTITNIAFWNNGTDTINRTDIPSNDVFSITINSNYDILDANITKVINESNNTKIILSENKKAITIDFEYLDKNEGFILQLFHNTANSENLKINGSIKGFGKISKGYKENDNLQIITKELLSPITISVVIIFVLEYLLSFSIPIGIFIFLVIILAALLGYIKYKILYPIPKSLE